MKKDNFEERLENLKIPDIVPPKQSQLKLAIISSKRSLKLSLWLLGVPFLVLLSALIENLFHVGIPPWSLIKHYGPLWPLWVRISVFTTVVIIIPLTAVLLNLLAIMYVRYDREQKVLHISIRLKRTNVIILVIAGIIAILFIGHSIADRITGN